MKPIYWILSFAALLLAGCAEKATIPSECDVVADPVKKLNIIVCPSKVVLNHKI